MIDKWMNQRFDLAKRNYSNSFSAEPFVEFGVIRGMIQPITGRLSTRSGKDAGEAAYMLYTPIASDIDAGDRITAKDGKVFIAQFVQNEGISGVSDHQEVTVELVT